MTATDYQGLEPAAVVDTEFEAQTKAAVLESEGIVCRVITHTPSWSGSVNLSSSQQGSVVLVKQLDLDRAKELLKKRVDDSVDLDWDEVDVGEREDSLPLTPVGRMAPLPKIIFTVILLSLVTGLIGLFIRGIFKL